MGFISVEDARLPAPTNGTKTHETTGPAFTSFNIEALASDKATPTGMKEEVVLLSWLIVLLRSREDTQVSYDWSYTNGQNGQQITNKLSMNEVMKGLESNVGEVATAILQTIPTGSSSSTSMILSTSTLVQTSETIKDEVCMQSIENLTQC